jgi:hypothetical protein
MLNYQRVSHFRIIPAIEVASIQVQQVEAFLTHCTAVPETANTNNRDGNNRNCYDLQKGLCAPSIINGAIFPSCWYHPISSRNKT